VEPRNLSWGIFLAKNRNCPAFKVAQSLSKLAIVYFNEVGGATSMAAFMGDESILSSLAVRKENIDSLFLGEFPFSLLK
jgi:hypothetical protein